MVELKLDRQDSDGTKHYVVTGSAQEIAQIAATKLAHDLRISPTKFESVSVEDYDGPCSSEGDTIVRIEFQ